MKQAATFGKRLAGMALVMLMTAASLAGCGDVPEAEEAAGNGTTESTPMSAENPQTTKKGTYTMSEAFGQKGTHIWYMVEEMGGSIGKDSNVTTIYVVQDGQVQVYDYSFSLGELAQLTDEEILEKLAEKAAETEERDRETVKEALEIAELALAEPWFDGVFLSPYTDEGFFCFYDFSACKAEYEQYKTDLENYEWTVPGGSYNLCIYTDSTDTKTATEAVKFENTASAIPQYRTIEFEIVDGQIYCNHYNGELSSYYGFGGLLEGNYGYEEADPPTPNMEQIKEILERDLTAENWELSFEFIEFVPYEDSHYTSPEPSGSGHKYIATGPVNAPEDGIQVYTSFYNGFSVGGDGSRRDGSLITRIDGKVNFLLDEAGTKGIVLDDKNF